jgi:ABC-type Fe3+/spermidine/putrescine transport system ATPase subunit
LTDHRLDLIRYETQEARQEALNIFEDREELLQLVKDKMDSNKLQVRLDLGDQQREALIERIMNKQRILAVKRANERQIMLKQGYIYPLIETDG